MTASLRHGPLAPRKQASQARAARTVGLILEGAARILEENGFEGYTTNAVARRAGVSIGSLYQYFPGKDAITIALISRESSGLFSEVMEAAALSDWRSALEGMIGAAVRHQMRRPKLARLLDLAESRLPHPTRDGTAIHTMHAAVRSVLLRTGLELHARADVVAFDVMAITRGITDTAGERGETDGDDLKARALRAVYGYIGALPAC